MIFTKKKINESQKLMDELYRNNKVISTGKFLKKIAEEYSLNLEISFIAGSAFPLNYAILKALCLKFNPKCYLEIGSYIGESIYNIEDICDKCISITAPLNAPYSMKGYCEQFGIHNFSNRLINEEKVTQYLTNSQKFKFNKISEKPDLILIDGDNSYQGIYNDTVHIRSIRKKNTIILWQCIKRNPSSKRPYDNNLKAIKEALTLKEYKNVYIFDNSGFGIYLPDKYMTEIKDCFYFDEEILYTYKLKFEIYEK